MNASFSDQKPGLFNAIAWMTLASGVINLLWGFVASATALGTIVGVICLPITILPTILGAFEIIYAAKLLSAQPQPVQPSTAIAVFQILTFFMGNIFSTVVGILSLIFYNDLTVKAYFSQINNNQTRDAVAPTAPAPLQIEEPQPEIISEPVVENTPEEPALPEKPKKPRKTSK